LLLRVSNPKVLVAVTGASGIVYAKRLVEILWHSNMLEAVLYTQAAVRVAREEGINLPEFLEGIDVKTYVDTDIEAPYASSSRIKGPMVIVPCSSRTLAAIAHGIADNLVTRAALATLRVGQKLVLVVRETPLGIAEIRNMLLAAENGAMILPASPAFYHKPQSISDLIDFIVGKVLDVLGFNHKLYTRWREIQV